LRPNKQNALLQVVYRYSSSASLREQLLSLL
jgi:hypothetical protein